MQAKKRFLLVVVVGIAFLGIRYFGSFSPSLAPSSGDQLDVSRLPSLTASRWWQEVQPAGPAAAEDVADAAVDPRHCRMETCFDLGRCVRRPFRVFVYPSLGSTPVSLAYSRMLQVLRESRLYTDRPEEACVFVLSLDTLDRDQLSADYVRNLDRLVPALEHWNGGVNHIVFNFFSGTWPNYTEDLGFSLGRALLAKASMSEQHFRNGFDISLPLLPKDHPERGGEESLIDSFKFPSKKQFLLGFKGKRYVYGIGSRTRNSLFHLHNGQDVVMVTTCKHGRDWQQWKDSRCDADMQMYNRYDYDGLVQNSTFCLVPRGRRVGSFRFLEVLQAGCIPVLLANEWRLPFDEVIDWNRAAVWGDERLMLQITETVRHISPQRVLRMRQNAHLLWNAYFSSLERVVMTTLKIVEQRVDSHRSLSGSAWMRWPGALFHLPGFSDSIVDLPFFQQPLQQQHHPRQDVQHALQQHHRPGQDFQRPASNFTAVVLCQRGWTPTLRNLIVEVCGSRHVSAMILIWTSTAQPPSSLQRIRSQYRVPIHVLTHLPSTMSSRFLPSRLISTDAVLSLNEDVSLITEEIDFLYKVWRHFPERIVGFSGRSHYWDEKAGRWKYTSKWLNQYSMVLTSGAMYHNYYHTVYSNWSSSAMLRTVDHSHNCEDILMNFVVSHVTRRAPVKVTQRKQLTADVNNIVRSVTDERDHFLQRHACMNTFAALFGYMPLLQSSVRFDPVLYRDNVAVWRKRYRRLENLQPPPARAPNSSAQEHG